MAAPDKRTARLIQMDRKHLKRAELAATRYNIGRSSVEDLSRAESRALDLGRFAPSKEGSFSGILHRIFSL